MYFYEGKMCAVGRVCKNPREVEDMFHEQNAVDIHDDFFLEPYRGHDKQFWCEIQQLHDSNVNWSEFGLNEVGVDHIHDIADGYGIDKRDIMIGGQRLDKIQTGV